MQTPEPLAHSRHRSTGLRQRLKRPTETGPTTLDCLLEVNAIIGGHIPGNIAMLNRSKLRQRGAGDVKPKCMPKREKLFEDGEAYARVTSPKRYQDAYLLKTALRELPHEGGFLLRIICDRKQKASFRNACRPTEKEEEHCLKSGF